MSESFIVSGDKVKLSLQIVTKQLEKEANDLLDQAEIEYLKLIQQGYPAKQAESTVMGWIQNNEGFAKAFWNRQNKLISELENKLVATPVHEYGDQHPDELLKWVLGETVIHHCSDCLRLSKLPPMTIGDWRKLKTGLPGEGKTECSFGCRCKLSPVNGDGVSVNMSYEEAIKEILDKTKNKFERGHCFDQKGRIIVSRTGEERSISFSNEEIIKMNGAKLLIHNHPSSSSFSPADITTTLANNIDEVWAVAPKSELGNGYFYIRPTLPKDKTIQEFLLEIRYNINKTSSEVESKFWNKISNNEITIDYAEKMHQHEVWKIISKKYGWKYGFQQRD